MLEQNSVLVLSSFFTGIISGVMGMIGGIVLLSIMTLYYSAAEALPLHGVVQFFSNLSRTFFYWKLIKKDIMLLFAFGVALGSWTGSQLVIDLSANFYNLLLGALMLLITWLPKFKLKLGVGQWRFAFLGFFGGFVSLFVGAVGQLMGAFFLRENLGKEALIGTQATCQVIIHFAKVITFVALGFMLSKYLTLLLMMIGASFAGNYVATFLLKKIPEALFLKIFKGLVTLLALRMVVSALTT